MSIAIIGGGINGMLTAYWLSKAGHQVTLFDSGMIPNHSAASFGRHRLIHPWGGEKRARLASKSLSLWREILSSIDCDGFEPCGVFAIGKESTRTDYDALGILYAEQEIGERHRSAAISAGSHGILFQEYGVLFADRIVERLCHYLSKREVDLVAHSAVIAVDAESGSILLRGGQRVHADHIIVAAGVGTGDIIANSPSLQSLQHLGFIPMVCHVAYIDRFLDHGSDHRQSAWADLGTGDLWGMPPLRGIPTKLGCGDLTYAQGSRIASDRSEIGRLILAKYTQLFPALAGSKILAVGQGSWTAIKSNEVFHRVARCWILTSDNGGGFKVSPAVTAMLSKDISSFRG